MDWEGFFTSYRKPGFIPGFEIVNKLGSGVFGEVYKARKESIGKFYAIKFLKVTDERVSEAIFKELDSLRFFAQIDHPNLVSIEDKGEVMGIPYIIMGYAGDETLKKRLAQGALPEAEADEMFRQICSGVAALHEKSIIHFDLKPANIFMKGHHARVGDYGLSKLVSESHMTMSIGRGTPYYMAPEMLTRKGDHRSDIYSLGVILYEMLTGRVPFTGDSEWEVLRKHENQKLEIPDIVKPPYRGIIQRCMCKQPEGRFQSVNEILALLEGRPVTASRPPAASPKRGCGPPPLPRKSGECGGFRKRTRVEKRLGGELGRLAEVARRNPRSEEYRAEFAAARAAKVLEPVGQDSVYIDFEEDPDEPSAAPSNEAAAARPSRPARRRRSFFGWLFRPVTVLISGVMGLLKGILRGLGVFFANFLRYALVIGITLALALLIHAALRGFDGELIFAGW